MPCCNVCNRQPAASASVLDAIQINQEILMSTSTIVIGVFAILAIFSLFEFIYCAWADRRENQARENEHSK